MADPIAAASLGLALYESWSKRQRDRVIEGLFSRIADLEKQVGKLNKHQAAQMDSLIGRAVSTALKDARSWKLSAMASLLDKDFSDDTGMEEIASCMDILDRLDVRHVRVITAMRALPFDDSSTIDATRENADPKLLDTITYDSIERYTKHAFDMNASINWSSINDLSNWCVIRTHPSSKKSKGKMIININPHGLLRLQSFSFSVIGKMLLGVLDLHASDGRIDILGSVS